MWVNIKSEFKNTKTLKIILKIMREKNRKYQTVFQLQFGFIKIVFTQTRYFHKKLTLLLNALRTRILEK